MIYYKYTYTFTDDSQKNSTITIVEKCKDADYTTSLESTKLIVRQQIYLIYDKLFDGVENVTTITLAQYNALVKGEDILEPIPDWDPNQPTNEEPI
jgi:hypothetical protein